MSTDLSLPVLHTAATLTRVLVAGGMKLTVLLLVVCGVTLTASFRTPEEHNRNRRSINYFADTIYPLVSIVNRNYASYFYVQSSFG